LRVVHVIPGLTTGGAEAVLYRLVTSARSAEHEVICLGERAWYSEKLEERGVRVHHVRWSLASSIPALWRLHCLIRSIDADLVQTWMYRANLFAGLSSRIAGKPVVWNVRSSTLSFYPLPTRLLAYCGGLFARWIPDRIINCSAMSRQLHARFGYDWAKGALIPNGYDPAAFFPDDSDRAALRGELGIEPGSFTIGTIGRWDPNKGYPVLLEALRLVRQRGIPAKLLMVGRDLEDANAEVTGLVASSGCEAAVRLCGERLDIAWIARAIDLHVLSSVSEGFPNVVAESMLSGTPNAVTDVGEAGLIVGDAGWVVPPGDSEQLAAAIADAHAEWSDRPQEWQARRTASRERIIAQFPIDAMVRAYEDVWREVGGGAEPKLETAAPAVAARPPRPDRKRLRILHIINDLTLGGAEALLYRITTRDTVDEHVVVSLGQPAWYSSRLEERGIRLHHLGIKSPAALPAALLRLGKLVRESGADVVHCWLYHSNVLGGLVAKAAGKPVVWAIHNTSLEPVRPRSRAIVYFGGMIARWTPDYVINCSQRSADLHGRFGYSAAPGAVVRNGYDSSLWLPDEASRAGTRQKLGLSPDDFVIGSVARWNSLKDIPNLLAALGMLKARGVPFRCFLVGAGLTPDNKALAAEIARTGCEGLVVPLGARSDVQQLARAFDLHVLASRTESFPNVVAETMLSNTPNVVTDVGDSAVMVGDTGWVVPPRSPGALADAMAAAYREWNDRRPEWEARRRASRSQIADNFSFGAMAEAYRSIWRQVAAKGSVSPAWRRPPSSRGSRP
jgi:glycosyltransferase involved in cell wall biosynthesis